MREILNRFKYAIFICLLVTICFVLYCSFSYTVTHNADNTSALLEAQEMITGNPLLRGWNLPADSFISIDIPIYAFFEKLYGYINPDLLFIVPSILFTCVVVLSAFMTGWLKKGKEKYAAIFFTVISIGTPGAFLANESLLGPIHMGTILMILMSFFCYFIFVRFTQNRLISLVSMGLLFLLTLLASLGDPLTVSVEIVPLALVCGVFIYKKREKLFESIPLFMIVTGYIFSVLLHRYLTRTGTIIDTTSFIFIPSNNLISNIVQTIQSSAALFSADFFGKQLFAKAFIPILLHLVLFSVSIMSLVYVGKKFGQNMMGYMIENRVDALLFIVIVINLLSFFMSTYPQGDITNARYLLPFFFCTGILAGRVITPFMIEKKYEISILSIVLAFVGLLFIRNAFFISKNTQPEKNVVRLLESKHLGYGYGNYWASSIITAYANNRIKVRAIKPSSQGMMPDDFLGNSNWYRMDNNNQRMFVITSDFYTPPGFINTAVSDFGPFAKSYTILPYHIYIWTHSLSIVQ